MRIEIHVRVFDSPVLSGVFGLIAPRSAAQRNDENPSGRRSGRHDPMLYSWHGQSQWPRIMLPVTDTMSLPITLSSNFYGRVGKVSGPARPTKLIRGLFF